MNVKLRLRRLAAPTLRVTSPGFACCHHCGWPWRYTNQHEVRWAEHRGFMISCTFCYPHLTAVDAVKYAIEILYGEGIGWRWNQSWDDGDDRQQVLRAVCAHWGSVGNGEVNSIVGDAWSRLRKYHPWSR